MNQNVEKERIAYPSTMQNKRNDSDASNKHAVFSKLSDSDGYK